MTVCRKVKQRLNLKKAETATISTQAKVAVGQPKKPPASPMRKPTASPKKPPGSPTRKQPASPPRKQPASPSKKPPASPPRKPPASPPRKPAVSQKKQKKPVSDTDEVFGFTEKYKNFLIARREIILKGQE